MNFLFALSKTAQRFVPRFYLPAILLLLNCGSVHAQTEQAITITGFSHAGVDTLVLVKPYQDVRYQGVRIPIKEDSTFSFAFNSRRVEQYELIYSGEVSNGTWRPIDFFTDAADIHFEIMPLANRRDTKISGSPLTTSANHFNSSLEEKWMPVYKRSMEQAQSLSPDSVRYVRDSLFREVFLWQIQELNDYPLALQLAALYDNAQNAQGNQMVRSDLVSYYDGLAEQHPDDALLKIIKHKIDASLSDLIGQASADFYLFKSFSDSLLLSSALSESNFTLLDLWSLWCGPCIKKSRIVEDNYSTLSENDVQVIGILGGVKTHDQFEAARRKYPYPWKIYPEILDKQSIWSRYGFEYSGGGQILIDRKGTVRAINPTIKEVLEITR